MDSLRLGWKIRKHLRLNFTRISRIESTNIAKQLQLNSLISTTRYVEKHMLDARKFSDRFDLIEYALTQATLNNGMYLEFGVHTGKSINFAAKRIKDTIHGFDSFEGLPEFWRDGYDEGVFDLGAKLPKVFRNVKLYKGWFDKTLPEFLGSDLNLGTIAYMHIDCDLYSSTKTIFENLKDYIIPGTVIVFDDYMNHPGWETGEHQALQELVTKTGMKYKYVGFNQFGEQVAIKVIGSTETK